MKKGIKIFLIMLGIIVFLVIIITFGGEDNTKNITQQTTKEVELTSKLIEEVCREIKIYTDYCYEKGISAEDCGEQMYDKLIRIFDLTPNQILEITPNCN